jgi:hypothetical protein
MIKFLEKIIHRKYKNHKCIDCVYCIQEDGAVDDGYCNSKHSNVLLNGSACKDFTTYPVLKEKEDEVSYSYKEFIEKYYD